MTRFDRFGFGRVLAAGLLVYLLLGPRLVEIIVVGVAALFCWRLLGGWLETELRRLRR